VALRLKYFYCFSGAYQEYKPKYDERVNGEIYGPLPDQYLGNRLTFHNAAVECSF
jgi:hypothetical protein